MFCMGSIDVLIKYYEIFKDKKNAGEHKLRIATIFTYGANEEDKDADGLIEDPDFDIKKDEPVNKHSREKLDEFIADYNAMYKTKFSEKDSKSFYNYYKDIGRRIKDREKTTFNDKNRVDVLLVVNMFLTGFDAKKVNTLYVDKNLRHHGLIQAYSRTNRILNEKKSHGNIIYFRNLKKKTDEAIALFSDKDAQEDILMAPYDEYVKRFNEAVKILKSIAPTVASVDDLPSEKEILNFVKSYRELIRIKNILGGFSEFTFDDLYMNEQEFADYKSKYLDIHDKIKTQSDDGEVASIIDDVDFELELIRRDEINVAYILSLLASLHDSKKPTDQEKKRKAINDLLVSETSLRSKKELIEKFINENMPEIRKSDTIPDEFAAFWNNERNMALQALCQEEGLVEKKLYTVIDEYLFTGREPLRDEIIDALKIKPKMLEKKTIIERVTEKILKFINIYDDDMGDV